MQLKCSYFVHLLAIVYSLMNAIQNADFNLIKKFQNYGIIKNKTHCSKYSEDIYRMIIRKRDKNGKT